MNGGGLHLTVGTRNVRIARLRRLRRGAYEGLSRSEKNKTARVLDIVTHGVALRARISASFTGKDCKRKLVQSDLSVYSTSPSRKTLYAHSEMERAHMVVPWPFRTISV